MTTLCISKPWKTFSPRNILIGIIITENMDWGHHIPDISSKATKTLGFLRRKLAFAPRSTKAVAYKTLVHPKLEYAAPFGALIVKLRFNKWRRYRGRQPAGPAGGGATLVVLEKCSMSCNGQLWRPGGISPLCFSSTRFIVGQRQVLDPVSEYKIYQVIT